MLLVNDPGFGDPEVIIAAVGSELRFAYDFTAAAGDAEEFGAFLIDAATGLSLGAAFEFFIDSPAMGLVTFNLSSLVGTTLGLQFQLERLPADSASTAQVRVSMVTSTSP